MWRIEPALPLRRKLPFGHQISSLSLPCCWCLLSESNPYWNGCAINTKSHQFCASTSRDRHLSPPDSSPKQRLFSKILKFPQFCSVPRIPCLQRKFLLSNNITTILQYFFFFIEYIYRVSDANLSIVSVMSCIIHVQ